ncbi:MAG: hypothetical protein HY704_08965 [Gemmatimonadetes bacterium]|nr:hypothetical protein [Gemmatimonadota bacterium]
MTLSGKALALALGLLTAIALFLGTLLSMLMGTGATMGALRAAMPGYSPYGIVGAIVGAIWAFIYGGLGGWLIALFYNMFASGGEAAGGGSPSA